MRIITGIAAAIILSASVALGGQHKTHTVFTDITDPAAHRVLWEGDNVITGCGVRNMFALAMGLSTMGASAGSAGTQGELCAGTNGLSEATVPEASGWNIRVGASANASCVSSGSPWACCTGSTTGTCDTYASRDVVLFTQGGVAGASRAAQETNFAARIGSTFTTGLLATRSLYWDGGSLQGARFFAVADGATANHPWCEYGVRTGGVAAGAGSLGASVSSTSYRSGWQLNHKAISPCITKTTGQIIQVTVTITWQ